ncbi:MAG TPA: Yip1 family protein [Anaerolineales bacterium]|nr:Yip1 family protein [Anaerolineales bacterium]HMX21335.1 Yip1 family protein [Anaerolineales bacterium]HMZ45160.1 Yip1 family protein [Anaerolineales bacterium]HNB88739.1 Yip1 family protein [Anaerolineales bacterium]HNC91031.1 Yip1 family protein [Anaerolineales bacterium]
MSGLNNAIQLIREGRKEEARKILELILRSEPGNIQAWFWSVETYSSLEKRIQVLELCLEINPGNAQVLQALQKLRSQRPAQNAVTPPPAQPTHQTYSAPLRDEPPKPAASSYEPMYYEDKPKASSSTHPYFDDEPSAETDHYAYTSTPQKKDTISYSDTFSLTKPKPTRKSYAFHEVWMIALSMLRMDAYEDTLNDPEATTGRALEWIAYAGIISGLLFPFTLGASPQFAELQTMSELNQFFERFGTVAFTLILALAMAVISPLLSVISLTISAWFQNLIAAFMGGHGNFTRTIYAQAAYLAPLSILIAVIGIIPVVGQCFNSLVGIYGLVLNIRALQAAHSLTTGKAIGVIFLPSIFMIGFLCLAFFIVSAFN